MKYYKCSKNHWWFCADTKMLRQGHVCRRGARRCSLPLSYQGHSIPSKTKPDPLPEDQIKDDVTVTKEPSTSDQPPQSGSSNPLVFLPPPPQPSSGNINGIVQPRHDPGVRHDPDHASSHAVVDESDDQQQQQRESLE